jgi:hypothetical protein
VAHGKPNCQTVWLRTFAHEKKTLRRLNPGFAVEHMAHESLACAEGRAACLAALRNTQPLKRPPTRQRPVVGLLSPLESGLGNSAPVVSCAPVSRPPGCAPLSVESACTGVAGR